jgi:hypothetical protein
LVPVVVSDKGECEVDASGDTGGGPHVAVLDVDGIEVDRDVGVGVTQQAALGPVGGGTSGTQCESPRGAFSLWANVRFGAVVVSYVRRARAPHEYG